MQQPRQRRVLGSVGANDTRGLRPAAAKAGCTHAVVDRGSVRVYQKIHLFYGPGIARMRRGRMARLKLKVSGKCVSLRGGSVRRALVVSLARGSPGGHATCASILHF